MTTTLLIPLQATPQQFSIALGAKTYTMTCRWNSAPDGGWVLDFFDATNTTPIANNVPLITGADVLAGLEYLGFGGNLVVYTDGDETGVPTFTNLGVESNLYFNTDLSNG